MGYAVSFGPVVRTLKKMAESIGLNVLAIVLTVGIGVYAIPRYGVHGAAYSMFGWFIVSAVLTLLISRWLKFQNQNIHR
jgi:O-antigen/teichoic acid export membrane protein